jgi:hypothetical protein
MALWRCPHCGTPQPVAARCWVCRRSATSCGTCRHFRASVAARIGYCGLDRERRPLAGNEIRGCWDGLAVAEDSPATMPPSEIRAAVLPTEAFMGGFVPVDSTPAVVPPPLAAAPIEAPPAIAAPTPPEGLFWADLEG